MSRRGEIQVFSVSFLDVLSCALGGVLILLLMQMDTSQKAASEAAQVAQDMEDELKNEQDARKQAVDDLDNARDAGRQAADELKRERDAREQAEEDLEGEQAARELAERSAGLAVPLTLAFRIDWDKQVDIDLWVKDPSTATKPTPEEQFVWYDDDHRRSECGYLLRDEVNAAERKWELYFSMEEFPGVYEVYGHYYGESVGPVSVTLQAILYPGQPDRVQTLDDTLVTLRKGAAEPGVLLGKFELVKQGDQFVLRRFVP